ncbi:CsbD family protein [Amycolatopsis acidiphila]|uniref:CsbD family protein n=1 Tax=Amycolatopsis acidiphila TaxID=715473 RepID=UPI001643929B|nr:CsbD family protein [Amycolatopsis acidiphila]UIJ60398.1 CsbD family protein [Amycolatopsis acidiphila]GHG90410.1 hypothetical protein GCM10017788_65740 [Amycolatopsis acidiphila]
MSVFKRAQSRSQQLVGTAKERIGLNTGNRRLAASGRRDRMVGSVRETTNEVRDWPGAGSAPARRALGEARGRGAVP